MITGKDVKALAKRIEAHASVYEQARDKDGPKSNKQLQYELITNDFPGFLDGIYADLNLPPGAHSPEEIRDNFALTPMEEDHYIGLKILTDILEGKRIIGPGT